MLAENIKTIRKNKGYSQEELAEKIHVTRQTISKWENGQSVPDADLLKAMSEVLEVSVSELIDGDAEKIIANEAIIDQLARTNEQLILQNRRAKKRSRAIAAVAVAALVLLASFLTIRMVAQRREKGYHVRGREHLGVLTYQMPDDRYYHAEENDVFTIEEDGMHRVTGKIYKEPEYMTELWVLSHGAYDQENRENVIDFMMANAFSPGYDPIGTNTEAKEILPDGAEFFVAASNESVVEDGKNYGGTNYEAYIVLDGNLYHVIVYNGNNAVDDGESVISSMSIDPTLKEEYRPAG